MIGGGVAGADLLRSSKRKGIVSVVRGLKASEFDERHL